MKTELHILLRVLKSVLKSLALKKRITILSKFLRILKPVVQSHHTPMQEPCVVNITHFQCGGKPQSEVLSQ